MDIQKAFNKHFIEFVDDVATYLLTVWKFRRLLMHLE